MIQIDLRKLVALVGRRALALAVIALSAGGLSACCHPTIGDMALDKTTAGTGKDVKIRLQVRDAEGCKLQYNWRAEKGTVVAQGPLVFEATYHSPANPGTDNLEVVVLQAGREIARKSAKIIVVPADIVLNGAFGPNPTDERHELMLTTGGGLASLPVDDGVDLQGYVLEMSLQGGVGRQTQLFFKGRPGWASSYRWQEVNAGQVLRFDPARDPKAVDDKPDLAHTYGVGVRMYQTQGVQGVQVTSARLVFKDP
jgi:hypothetical protein